VRWEKREGTLWGVALFSQPAGPPMIFSGVFFIVNFVKVKLLSPQGGVLSGFCNNYIIKVVPKLQFLGKPLEPM
jgi:hypothetical protein